jgi:hypothetical protein
MQERVVALQAASVLLHVYKGFISIVLVCISI